MGYCANIVGDSCKKVTEQRGKKKLRNKTKEKKYTKTSKEGADTKCTKEWKKRLRRKHSKVVIFLRKTKLVSIP
jgi:hypothetical protein